MINKYSAHDELVFRKFYNKNLEPLYISLKQEKMRVLKEILLHNLKFALCGIFGSLFIWMIVFSGHALNISVFFKVIFVFFLIFIVTSITEIFISKPEKKYRNFAKELIAPKFISFFNGLKYGNFQISRKIIKESSLFVMSEFRNYFFEDGIKGKYKETTLQIAEERALGITSLCVFMNFSKKFSGKTIVCSSKRDAGFYILIYMLLIVLLSCVGIYFEPEAIPLFVLSWSVAIYFYLRDYKKSKEKLHESKMETINFSKEWKVETTDQIEARYILTPVLMERMMDIKRLFKSNIINFSFFDNKLLIVIHSYKNWFEVDCLSNSRYYERAKECFLQMKTLLSIIDILSTNKGDSY